jgi:predicted Rossmann fold flavoprotein
LKYANKTFKNSLDDLLPKSLIEIIVSLSGINPDKKVNEILREERLTLVNILQNLTLNITRPRQLAEAIVTSGGVATSEINPATMESKICPGVYFAGEVIDIDAYTGGFNLQIAFSTGHLAGSKA